MMKIKEIKRLRTVTALAVILIVVTITAAGFLRERGISVPEFIPSCLHGVCPFGGVVTLGRLIQTGLYVPRTGIANIFALIASLGTTVLFGAFFCGWLCPLGAVQDWVKMLGKKITSFFSGIVKKSGGKGRREVKRQKNLLLLDKILSYVRYVTLLLVLYATFRSFNLVFSSVDPFYALFHFWTGSAMPAALVILGVVLLLSLFVSRPWCRWFCPFGAVQGMVQKIAPWKIRRNADLCVSCGACDRSCPMNIDVSSKNTVTDGRCGRCLSCVASCPKPGALALSLPLPRGEGREIRESPGFLSRGRGGRIAAVIMLGFLLPLGAGWISGGTDDVPAVVEAGSVNYGEDDAYDPAPEDILESLSSSMTLKETAELMNMETVLLLDALGLPGEFDFSTRLRDLEEHQEEKTYRWIRSQIEALLKGESDKFTESSQYLPEAFVSGKYLVSEIH